MSTPHIAYIDEWLKMNPLDELANAISMIPFAYLSTLSHVHIALRINITVFYLSSFFYHVSLYRGDFKTGSKFLVSDTITQIINVMALSQVTDHYSRFVKCTFSVLCLTSIYKVLYIAKPYASAIQRKSRFLIFPIVVHVSHTVVALSYAKYRRYTYLSLTNLLFTAIAFMIHEMEVAYSWACGHIMCFFYTWYCWKALGVI